MDDLGQVVAVGIVALVLGWHAAGVWRETVREIRRQRYAKADAEERARLGMDVREKYGAPDVVPHVEGYFLAFYRDDSGLWAIGHTEMEARELAVRRWTDLGAGLSAEATAGDPTPAEWARGLVLVYVEVESEAVLRENVLCAVRDGELAYSPWGVGAVWEEA